MEKAKRTARPVITALVAGTILGVGLSADVAHADLLGSVFEGGIIAVLVKQFQKPLNEGINKLADSAGAPMTESTKVVPIFSLGQGGYVGAAQVLGQQTVLD